MLSGGVQDRDWDCKCDYSEAQFKLSRLGNGWASISAHVFGVAQTNMNRCVWRKRPEPYRPIDSFNG